MTTIHALRRMTAVAAVAALASTPLLPLAAGPVVKIRDAQYATFVSGASFTTDVPGESAVYTNAYETWTAGEGFVSEYWPNTNGVYRRDYRWDMDYLYGYGWASCYDQPPVYSRLDGTTTHPLYYYRYGGLGLAEIPAAAGMPATVKLVKNGELTPEYESDVFFDGNVALEVFPYGEENHPVDALAPDAKLAMYVQYTSPTGDGSPHLFIVARDWETGAVRHFMTDCRPTLNEHYDSARCYGRVVVQAVRNVHKGGKYDAPLPAFLVHWGDASGQPITADVGTSQDHIGSIQWSKVRDDLWDYVYEQWRHVPLFRPLGPDGTLGVSRLSLRGGARLGAYAVNRDNPLTTIVRWSADDTMICMLSIFSYDFHAADINKGSTTLRMRLVPYEYNGYAPLSFSWKGVNGWSDGSYTVRPEGGCEVEFGADCFQRGRASLSTMPADDEAWAEELEQRLPARTGERIGNRYVEVSDALAHAAVLGGTVTLLAYPMDALVITQLEASVTVDLTEHYVPYEWSYQEALGLSDPSCAGVIANPHPGAASVPTLTLLGGTITGDAYEYGGMVFGGLRTTGVSVDVRGVYFTRDSCICDAPHAAVYGRFGGDLYVTNSVLSISDGIYGEASHEGGVHEYTGLHVAGGGLHISGGYFVVLSAGDTTSGTISGGTFGSFSYTTDAEHIVWDDTVVSIAGAGVHISGGTFWCRLEGSGIPVSGGLFLVEANPDIATSGVVSLAPGKKFVRTWTTVPDAGKAFECWEVRDE